MKKVKEKQSDITKRLILETGVKLWPNVTAREIARRMGKTHPMVVYHFSEKQLKDAVAVHAVETDNSKVIAQLIATKHKAVKKLTPEERSKHMGAMV